jgi:DNA excision repair protein ERCC-2
MAIATANELGARRVIVAVRTHNEMTRYYDEVRKVGLKYTVIAMRSKVHLCRLCVESECDLTPEDIKCSECPYYRKVRDLIKWLRSDEDGDDIESLPPMRISIVEEKIAVLSRYPPDADPRELWRVLGDCPYQWSKVSAQYNWFFGYPTVLTVTYPYLFIPFIRRAIDFGMPDVVIIDEAHNLDDVNTLLERSISQVSIERALRDIALLRERGYITDDELVSRINNMITSFWGVVKRAIEATPVDEGKLKHVAHEDDIRSEVKNFLSEVKSLSREFGYDDVLEWISDLVDNLIMSGKRTRNYVRSLKTSIEFLHDALSGVETEWGIIRVYTDGKRLVIKPISVRSLIKKFLSWAGGSVILLMSGTLPSVDYMRHAWGLKVDDYIDISSDVRFGYRIVNVVGGVTTRYKSRSEEMMRKYADEITRIVSGNDGKVFMVVYPSYSIMRAVRRYISLSGVDEVVSGDEKSITNLMERVRKSSKLVVHAVARDRFTEGVELVGEDGRSLINHLIIVGIPYPDIGDDYVMDRIKDSGLPRRKFLVEQAKIALAQAIGRGIRGPSDVLRIHLLDLRYNTVPTWRKFVKRLMS